MILCLGVYPIFNSLFCNLTKNKNKTKKIDPQQNKTSDGMVQ